MNQLFKLSDETLKQAIKMLTYKWKYKKYQQWVMQKNQIENIELKIS